MLLASNILILGCFVPRRCLGGRNSRVARDLACAPCRGGRQVSGTWPATVLVREPEVPSTLPCRLPLSDLVTGKETPFLAAENNVLFDSIITVHK